MYYLGVFDFVDLFYGFCKGFAFSAVPLKMGAGGSIVQEWTSALVLWKRSGVGGDFCLHALSR